MNKYILRHKYIFRPKVTVLGNLTINGKGTHIYESIDSFSEAKEFPKIKILRFEESIYYANVTFFFIIRLFLLSS